MTNNDNVAGLCKRLRLDTSSRHYGGCANCDALVKEDAADTLERQAAENKRLRGKVASWAEQIDAISWTVNTSALDGLISEMRRTALTGEDND
jgi:hypothetical protein